MYIIRDYSTYLISFSFINRYDFGVMYSVKKTNYNIAHYKPTVIICSHRYSNISKSVHPQFLNKFVK